MAGGCEEEEAAAIAQRTLSTGLPGEEVGAL